MALLNNGHPLGACDECGIVDDHPRHSYAGTTTGDVFPPPSLDVVRKAMETTPTDAPQDVKDRILGNLLDRTLLDLHMDCCRSRGCPLPPDHPLNCANKTKGAERKRGGDLLAHLDRNKSKLHAALAKTNRVAEIDAYSRALEHNREHVRDLEAHLERLSKEG